MKKYLTTLFTLLIIFSSIAQQKKNNPSQKNIKPKAEKQSIEEIKTDVAETDTKVEILVNGVKKYLKLTGEQYENTELRGVTDDDKLGFINSENKLIIPLTYDITSDSFCNYGICLLQKNGKKGVIDEGKNEILPFIFENIRPLSKVYNTLNGGPGFISGFIAQLNDKWGIFDPFGNSIVTHSYDEIIPFEHEAEYLFSVLKNGKTGLIDKFGNVIIPIAYDSSIIHPVSLSNDDKFQVSENGLQKIANIKKNKVFQKGYYNLKSLSSSRFIVSISQIGNLGMIDEDENVIVPFEYDEIKPISYQRVGASSCLMIRKNGKIGVFNTDLHRVIIEPKFDNLEHIFGEYYKVNIANKWGISKNNEEVLSPEYDEIVYLKETLVAVKKASVTTNYDFCRQKIILLDKKKIWKGNYQSVEVNENTKIYGYFTAKKHTGEYGLIDSDENVIIPFELGYGSNTVVSETDNNFFPKKIIVEQNGKYGLFDKNLKLPLTEIKYSRLRGIIDSIYKGVVNGKMCLLKNGKEILSPIYDDITFTGGGKVKLLKERKVGIWDMNSETFFLDLKYDYINKESYYYVYYIDGKAGLIHENGTDLLPCEYERMEYNVLTNCFVVKKNGKAGLFHTKTNKLIIPAEFETIAYLKNHFIKVFKDNKWAIKHLQYSNINTPFVYQDVTMLGDNLFLLDGKKYRFIKDKMIEIPK